MMLPRRQLESEAFHATLWTILNLTAGGLFAYACYIELVVYR